MAISSALVFDLEGSLPGIPASSAPEIISLDTGGFALVAQSFNQTILVIYNEQGQIVASDAMAGTSPSIVQSANGNIIVAAAPVSQTDTTIYRYDVDGSFINQTTIVRQQQLFESEAIRFPGADFALAQVSFSNPDTDTQFAGLDSNNVPTSTFFGVELIIGRSSRDVSSALLSDGGIVAAVTLETLSSGAEVVRVRGKDATLTDTFTFDIDFPGNPGEVRNPSVVAFDGGFAVAYEARPFSFVATQDIFVNFYDNAGVFQYSENVSNPSLSLSFLDDGSQDRDPHLAVNASGNVVVTWTRDNNGSEDQMIALVNENNLPTTQIGFAMQANMQSNSQVAFFGVGNIAAFHYDATTNMITGEWITGERDTAGDAGDNLLQGDDFEDLMNGVEGRDTIYGGRNNDTLQGGDGNDWVYGGDGNDEIFGEEGVGAFGPGRHRDRLLGEAGDDTIFGEDDNDILNGGTDNDFLSGGDGRDKLLGESGDDTMFGDAGGDTLIGANGNDSMDGGANADLLEGGNNRDTLLGGTGLDTLDGGTGDDSMDGGFHDDLLIGGTGRDTMTGGQGADVFEFNSDITNANRKVITDFEAGIDILSLQSVEFSTLPAVLSSNNLRFGNQALDADDFLIYNPNTGFLRLDVDGNGAGQAVIFAELTPGTVLDITDFDLL